MSRHCVYSERLHNFCKKRCIHSNIITLHWIYENNNFINTSRNKNNLQSLIYNYWNRSKSCGHTSDVKFVSKRKIFFSETNIASVVHDECAASGLMLTTGRRMPQVSHMESAKASSSLAFKREQANASQPPFAILLFSPWDPTYAYTLPLPIYLFSVLSCLIHIFASNPYFQRID